MGENERDSETLFSAKGHVGDDPPGETPGNVTVDEVEGDDEPTGAIVVTTFLTVVIVVSWFGVLALFILRG